MASSSQQQQDPASQTTIPISSSIPIEENYAELESTLLTLIDNL